MPRHAFGHGLSYTSFVCRAASARLSNHAIEVSVAETNTGEVAAETPVLAFVSPPGMIDRWAYVLKAFARVVLAAGETRIVSMMIERCALHWYDHANSAWREEPGEYGLSFGADAVHAVKTSFRL